MNLHLDRLLHSAISPIAISCIIGFGLASFFRQSCNEHNCIRFRGPVISEMDGRTYKHGDKCYKYDVKSTTCDATKHKIVDIKRKPDEMTPKLPGSMLPSEKEMPVGDEGAATFSEEGFRSNTTVNNALARPLFTHFQ